MTLEAGPTDATATELTVTPPPKGAAGVVVSAGGTIGFNLSPKDTFGNSSELRDDAKASNFTWQLQKVHRRPKPCALPCPSTDEGNTYRRDRPDNHIILPSTPRHPTRLNPSPRP